MRLKHRLVSLSFFVFFLLKGIVFTFFFCSNAKCIGIQAYQDSNIVIVNSYHNGFSWSDGEMAGLQKTLQKAYITKDPWIVYIDAKVINGDDTAYFSKLYNLLKYKYQNHFVKLIISLDDAALKFNLRYRKELFNNAPIVFGGINFYNPQQFRNVDNITGIFEFTDPLSTLQLALKLHPKARNILLIFDGTDSGIQGREYVADRLKGLDPSIKLKYLLNPSLDELIKTISALPDDYIILHANMTKVREGITYKSHELVELMASKAKVPIYGIYDESIGYGLVGGKVINSYNYGEEVGALALKVLKGTKPDDLPFIFNPKAVYQFDYNKLKYYNVSLGDLPSGSFLLNKPFSFYEAYKTYIYIALAVFVVLTLTIATLLLNISARHRAQKALAISEMRYRQLSELTSDAASSVIIRDNLSLSTEWATGQLLSSYGYSWQEVDSFQKWESILYQEDKDIFRAGIAKVLNNESAEIEFRVNALNNEIRWISNSIHSEYDEKTGERRLLSAMKDITDRKKVEEELIKAKERAEEADQLKSAFLANMSHEIRTPMNAILGFANLLRDDKLGEQEKNKFTSIIIQSTNNLLNILNDILDISRIEAGQMTIHEIAGNLNEMLVEIYTFFSSSRSPNQKPEVEFKLSSLPEKEFSNVVADFSRVRQVLVNLIDNAFKFTYCGCVEFGCNINESGQLQFYVKDTGIGISKDAQQIIFDRFRQIESKTELRKGTGLGLSITKGLVDLLRGQIWIESEENVGSIFYFTVPYRRAEAELKKANYHQNLEIYHWKGKKILLVEDDMATTELLLSILKKTGIECVVINNGTKAIEMLNENSDFDLLLLDIELPGSNGVEITRHIKRVKPKTPVVIQSAYASDFYKERCFEAGCNAFVSKPIDSVSLLGVLEKHLVKS